MKRNIHAGKSENGGVAFSVLSDADMDRIHSATLEVLSQHGVFVEDEEGMEVFDGGGATVDPKTKIVKIPFYLLEEAVRSAPETVVLAGRNPNCDVAVEMNRVAFDPFGEGILMVDPNTVELRDATKADLAEIWLDDIGAAISEPFVVTANGGERFCNVKRELFIIE